MFFCGFEAKMPNYALNDGEWTLQYHAATVFALRDTTHLYTSTYKGTMDYLPLCMEGRGTLFGLFLGHVVSGGRTDFGVHGMFLADMYNFEGVTDAKIRVHRVDTYPTPTDIVTDKDETDDKLFPFVLCYITFELSWKAGERDHARYMELPFHRFCL
jgi:hypothetical protein